MKFFEFRSLNDDGFLLRKYTLSSAQKAFRTKIENEKTAGGSWASCYYEFEFCSFVGFFSYTFERKLSDFYSAFDAIKRWLLTIFVFLFHWNYFLFSKSHHFFYYFIRHLFIFTAGKCSLCQTLACTDRKSHKEKHLLLWDNKLQKKDRDAFPTFCFSNQQTFENVKRASSVYLYWWQRFPTKLRDAFPLLCSRKILPNGQKKLKFLQIFRQKFPQIVIVDT